MSVLAAIASSAGSGRINPAKPTLTYIGTGQFRIENYNSTLNYVLSGSGNISGNILNVTVSSGSASIYATSPKGLINSPTVIGYRQNRTWTTVNVPFQQCVNPCGDCNTNVDPHTWTCGCGSPCEDSGGGAWGDCICRGPGYSYQTEDSYSSAGYTFSSSGNEWYKIT